MRDDSPILITTGRDVYVRRDKFDELLDAVKEASKANIIGKNQHCTNVLNAAAIKAGAI